MKRIEHIFTDSIYHSVDKNLKIEDKLIKELEENKFWHRKSSMGGYQKNLTTCKEPFFKMIKHHGQEYLNMLEVKNHKIEVLNAWFNVNPTSSYNVSHVHAGAHLSGVYYLRTPKNCGNLKFWRNNDYLQMRMHGREGFGLHNFPEAPPFRVQYLVEPKQYLLIIFPAYLQHEVLQNNNKENRVSVSFNLAMNKI